MPGRNSRCLGEGSRVNSLLARRHRRASKVTRAHGAYSGAHVWIAKCPLDVRIAAPFPQRRVSAVVVMNIRDVRNIRDVDDITAVSTPAVPRIVAITGA